MNNDIARPAAKAKEPSTDAPNDQHRYQRSKRTYDEAIVQDQVIERALANEMQNLKNIAAALKEKRIKRIYILGCGDSWFSGVGVRYAFEKLLGIPVEPMQALDFSLYYHSTVDPKTLVVGISSGGNTKAVIDALNQAKTRGAITIGVTNTQGSPITKTFDHAIYVDATRKGWPTQASTAAMAILIQLALLLADKDRINNRNELKTLQEDLDAIPMIVSKVIKMADDPIKSLAEEIHKCRFMFFSAGGPSFAAAAFGAAKVKELCPIHAEAIPLEEFHHYRSLKPGDPLFLVAPDQESHERALDTAEVGTYDGGKVFAIIPEGEEAIKAAATWSLALPKVNPLLTAIVYSVPLHLFAYYLSMAKFENNLGYVSAFPNPGE